MAQNLWQSVDMVAGRSYSFSAYARSIGGPAQLYLNIAPYQNSDGTGSISTSEMNLRYHTSDVASV